MKKTVKEVIEKEVEVVELTEMEIIELTGDIVDDIVGEMIADNKGVVDVINAIGFSAELIGRLTDVLFNNDKDEESEEE